MADECCMRDCPRPAVDLAFCDVHLDRWNTSGHPLGLARVREYDLARFWAKVDKAGPVPPSRPDLGPCWIWNGNLSTTGHRAGYGRFLIGPQRYAPAHRYAYELVVGEIPDGLVIDHLCSVKSCVNPAHLEPVTRAENTRRAPKANALKTHCPQGHPYDEANTYTSGGGRLCRACRQIRNRARSAARGV